MSVYSNNEYFFKSAKVLGKDFEQWLHDTFVNAGWIQVSQNTDKDGYVFKSVGNEGNKSLVLNILKTTFFKGGVYYLTTYLPRGYTPGANPGDVGVFDRRGALTYSFSTYPNYLPQDRYLDIMYYVDKNGIILTLSNAEYAILRPAMLYLRLSDNRKSIDTNHRGLGFVAFGYSTTSYISDVNDPKPSSDVIIPLTIKCLFPTTGGPCYDGSLLLSVLYMESEGQTRFKLDGVSGYWHGKNETYDHGSYITVDGKKYFIVKLTPAYNIFAFTYFFLEVQQ